MIGYLKTSLLKETTKDNGRIKINVFIRGLNLLGKFFLIGYLAKYFGSDTLGVYTVFLTLITVSLYLIGFEFYTYSQRQISASKFSELPTHLINQFIFHSLSYVFLLPLSIAIAYNFIPIKALYFYVILLVLEHINQEIFRVLIALAYTTTANINFFFRSSFWIFVFIPISFYFEKFRTLNFVYLNWIAGQLICLLFSLYQFKNFDWSKLFHKIDKIWIGRGIQVSFVFFLSGMIQKILEYSERFYVQKIAGEKMVGVYFFFYNVAYLPYIFFSTSIIVIFFSKIVASYKNNDNNTYISTKAIFHNATKTFTLFFYPLTIVLFLLLMRFYLVDSLYIEHSHIFWILLIASFVTIISELLYLEMYIRNLDKAIFYSYLITLPISLSVNYLLINNYGITGAVVAKLFTILILFLSRIILFRISNAKAQ